MDLLTSTTPEHYFPRSIFKFVREEKYLDDLLAGRIWVTTLGVCRGLEAGARGDPEEGAMEYKINQLKGDSDDPEVQQRAAQLGISFRNGTNIIITDSSSLFSIPDAFVICTTAEFEPEVMVKEFGPYCAEITNTKRFMDLVGQGLANSLRKGLVGAAQHVTYADRFHADGDPAPGPAAFIKPAIPYASQKEFRFIYEIREKSAVKPIQIEPLMINVPAVAELIKIKLRP